MKPRPLFTTVAALTALSIAGCEREEIRVYTIAKEAATPAGSTEPERPSPAAGAARPQLTYTLPAGWKDAGGSSMSLANFRVKTDAGEASVNITPLGQHGRAGVRDREHVARAGGPEAARRRGDGGRIHAGRDRRGKRAAL